RVGQTPCSPDLHLAPDATANASEPERLLELGGPWQPQQSQDRTLEASQSVAPSSPQTTKGGAETLHEVNVSPAPTCTAVPVLRRQVATQAEASVLESVPGAGRAVVDAPAASGAEDEGAAPDAAEVQGIYTRAEDSRRGKDYTRAVALYSEVLERA